MSPKHHSDSGQGWIRREFKEIRRLIRESNAARRLEAATIGKGGLTVKLGGRIQALYPSGPAAAYWGRLFRDINGDTVYGIGTLDRQGSSVFTAYCYDTPGDRGVIDGDAEFVGFEGYSQVFINSGDDNFIEMTPTNIWIQHDNPAGNPNLIAVDANGITLQAITGTHTMPGMGSTGNSPNLWIDVGNGDIKRSTSSRRYKRDFTDAEIDLAQVLALVPRRFRMIEEVEKLGDDAPTYVGFIAEEAHDLGLTDWVTYDAEGRPEAFDYAMFCVAQHAVLVDLARRVANLEER